jgi:nitrile hydratase
MNGIHDMGGMHGFGPVIPERDEPVFHHEWERRAFALALATLAGRHFNVDELRRTIERMEPARYLSASYYERWLHAVESLLLEKHVLSREELNRASANTPAETQDSETQRNPSASERADARQSAPATKRPQQARPKFQAGDRILARNINPQGHTRLPRYIRGHRGTVIRDWGIFALPDTYAHGGGAHAQHCYAVEFAARELWGRDHPTRDRIVIDLWEDYIEHDSSKVKAAIIPMAKHRASAKKSGRARRNR